MNRISTLIDRRALFAVGGAGAVAVAGMAALSGQAQAAPMTETETANVKLVRAFCKDAEEKKPDVAKLIGYFSDDAMMNFGDPVPIAKGKAACTTLLNSFYTHGESYGLKITEVVARGPVVLTMRQDTTTKDGKTSKPVSVFGVFYVKDGKIKEWTDFT